MDDDQHRRLYAPILERPWVHRETDYNGNAGIATDEGMYVCSVPHEVARRIVEDHNTVLRRLERHRQSGATDPSRPVGAEPASDALP
jgi:hypothetical protein